MTYKVDRSSIDRSQRVVMLGVGWGGWGDEWTVVC